jgi:hypothetical protein
MAACVAPAAASSLLLALAWDSDLPPAATFPAPAGPGPDGAASRPPDQSLRQPPLTIDLFAGQAEVEAGAVVELAVRLTFDDGWHAPTASAVTGSLSPTTLRLTGPDWARPERLDCPPGETLALTPGTEPVPLLRGCVWHRLGVRVDREAPVGPAALTLELRVQPCDSSRCGAPQTLRLSMPLTVTAAPDVPRQ